MAVVVVVATSTAAPWEASHLPTGLTASGANRQERLLLESGRSGRRFAYVRAERDLGSTTKKTPAEMSTEALHSMRVRRSR